MRLLLASSFVYLSAIILSLTSCASTPKKFDWDAVPLVFSKEILEQDFSGRITELRPSGQVGRGGWSFDPEEPRYVCATGERLLLYDRFFGGLYALNLEQKTATRTFGLPREEAKHVIGIDARADGRLLIYSRAHFYFSDLQQPLKNIALAESVAFCGDSLIAINNPDVAGTEKRLLLELDNNGAILETYCNYNFSSTELGEKYNHHIRVHGDTAVVWNSDFAEISLIDLASRTQSLITLQHPILEKRSKINGGEYFAEMASRRTPHMVLPVIVDVDLADEGMFALLSNEGIGMIAALSPGGDIDEIYTFPLVRIEVALDFAVIQRENELTFCVIIARGQRLSAKLFSTPAAGE